MVKRSAGNGFYLVALYHNPCCQETPFNAFTFNGI